MSGLDLCPLCRTILTVRIADLTDVAEVRDLIRTGQARAIREAAGLSLSDLAGALGVWPSTVLRWERGDRRARGPAAARYYRLLGRLASIGSTVRSHEESPRSTSTSGDGRQRKSTRERSTT
jgi:transcriptional regulator with XRE-family HTH domain